MALSCVCVRREILAPAKAALRTMCSSCTCPRTPAKSTPSCSTRCSGIRNASSVTRARNRWSTHSLVIGRGGRATVGTLYLSCRLEDPKQSREDVRADTRNERASVLGLVVDGGRPRLGRVHPAPPAGSRNGSAAQTQRSSRPGQVPSACSMVSPESVAGLARSGPQKGKHVSPGLGDRCSEWTRYLNLPSECIVCQRRLRSSEESKCKRMVDRKTAF
jgi:hypothetical protein